MGMGIITLYNTITWFNGIFLQKSAQIITLSDGNHTQ
jgi:hypothetical protein